MLGFIDEEGYHLRVTILVACEKMICAKKTNYSALRSY